MGSDPMSAEVAELLAGEGIAPAGIALEQCHVGGNNRVFVVRAGDHTYVAKWYFVHPGDDRDRLHAEYSFVGYAMRAGIRAVPRAISCDRDRHLAVYEFIEGRKLTPGEVEGRHVEQAARFVEALNAPTARPLAADLPRASEASFSLAEHFDTVERRIDRLRSIEGPAEIDRAATRFVGELAEGWRRLRHRLAREAAAAGEDLQRPLELAMRCVSPSDFGFHNALERPSGELCFIDFEYAGWDDPAKTIGDFFSQPAVPVPLRFFESFLAAATRFAPDPELLAWRARLLLPVFQAKWCCIMLNDFLPVSLQRRRFANPALDEAAAKARQLAKAVESFSYIQL